MKNYQVFYSIHKMNKSIIVASDTENDAKNIALCILTSKYQKPMIKISNYISGFIDTNNSEIAEHGVSTQDYLVPEKFAHHLTFRTKKYEPVIITPKILILAVKELSQVSGNLVKL